MLSKKNKNPACFSQTQFCSFSKSPARHLQASAGAKECCMLRQPWEAFGCHMPHASTRPRHTATLALWLGRLSFSGCRTSLPAWIACGVAQTERGLRGHCTVLCQCCRAVLLQSSYGVPVYGHSMHPKVRAPCARAALAPPPSLWRTVQGVCSAHWAYHATLSRR